jgi:hypothetical protein
MNRDIRAVVMCQVDYSKGLEFFNSTKPDSGNTFFQGKKELCAHVAAGDFDAILSYKVDDPFAAEPSTEDHRDRDSVLKTLFNENIALTAHLKGAKHFHPLYLIRNLEAADGMEAFWKADRTFFFFTSVYGTSATGDPEEARKLEAKIKGIIDENNITSVECRVYQTLQISEFMLVWKADHVQAVLKVLHDYYESTDSDTPYTRTVCGIPYGHCEPFIGKQPQAFEAEGMRPSLLESTTGGCAELLKVEIRSVAKCYKALKKLQGNAYFKDLIDTLEKRHPDDHFEKRFVLGKDDAAFSIPKGLTSCDVFDWFCTLLTILRQEPDALAKATEDFRTSVSMKIEPSMQEEDAAYCHENTGLQEIANALVQSVEGLKQNESIRKDLQSRQWYFDFVNQMERFRTMAASRVSHNTCYFLMDSAIFLSEWLTAAYKLEKKERELLLKRHEKQINDTLSTFSRLASNIMRSEAITDHRPTTPPPGDNIAIGAIPYYRSFILKTAGFFDYLDSTHDGTTAFALLALPMLCRHPKTFEKFSLENAEKLNEKAPKSPFLYVEIPIKSISEPRSTLAIVVHEMAHYFGDRLREARNLCLQKCCAFIVGSTLGCVAPESYRLLVEKIIELFWRNASDSHALLFWCKARQEFEFALHAMLADRDFLEQLAQAEADQQTARSRAPRLKRSRTALVTQKKQDMLNRIEKNYLQNRTVNQNTFDGSDNPIHEMVALLYCYTKECYADLMCVFTLALTPAQYYAIFKVDIDCIGDDARKQQRLWNRFLLVASTLVKAEEWQRQDAGDQEALPLDRKIFLNELNDIVDNPRGELAWLQEYLLACLMKAKHDFRHGAKDNNAELLEETRACLRKQYAEVILKNDGILTAEYTKLIAKANEARVELFKQTNPFSLLLEP